MKTANAISVIKVSGITPAHFPSPRKTEGGAMFGARKCAGSKTQIASWLGELAQSGSDVSIKAVTFEDGKVAIYFPFRSEEAKDWKSEVEALITEGHTALGGHVEAGKFDAAVEVWTSTEHLQQWVWV
jgi:hypothetical protein